MNLSTKIKYRVNYQIRIPQIRVNFNNQQLGVMSTDSARKLAQENNLDLIEVVPNANPPICCIADFGLLKYEAKLKEKEQQKKQRAAIQEVKEIRLTPTTTAHDIEHKTKSISRFIEEGKKVQIVMKFSPRELHHKDIGFQTINSVLESFTEKVVVEQPPRFNGRNLNCLISPKGK